MKISVEEYLKADETSPYAEWFNSLSSQAAAKVSVAVARMEAGNISNIKWFGGLGEYRIDWGSGYRIYLASEGKQLIILFGGGDKSTQKTDINTAKKLLAEYKSRKNAAKKKR